MDFTKDIYINKDTVYENQEIVVLYKGSLFSDNLTSDLFISYGYGENWDNKNEVKMKPSTFGYLATVKIESGSELQFCFRDNLGNWDNNENGNYILPIHESTEEILSFKTLESTIKDVKIEIVPDEKEAKNEEISIEDDFETTIVSSNQVEFYNTVDLENIATPAIPNDTIITQINLNEEAETTITQAVIKTEETQESVFQKFDEIVEEISTPAIETNIQTITAPENQEDVSTGSLYVNSIIKDTEESISQPETTSEEKYLIDMENITFGEKVASFFDVLFKRVKTGTSKLVTLIKTSFNFGEDEN